MRKKLWADDAKELGTILASGAVAALFTAGLLVAAFAGSPEVREIRIATTKELVPLEGARPATGVERLYGTVTRTDGYAHRGYIRWDRNEGSWADVLEANKRIEGRSARQAGIRFGHIARIDVLDRSSARVTLKNGAQVEFGARATDLGSGLRALIVREADGSSVEMEWDDVQSVTFEAAPDDPAPMETRLYGTLTTAAGDAFTGYVAWDVDEIYSSDVLDGEDGGTDYEVPFGSIAEISRESSRAARVLLNDGRELVLRGTNDVNSSNGGVSVYDPELGEVTVGWGEFESVRFHAPAAEPGYGSFEGAGRLVGTVVTEDGLEISGEIAWDSDESYGWEMLDGDARGTEFQIEFGRIARLVHAGDATLVELRDGRSFELSGSNDVDDDNGGIVVTLDDGTTTRVDWDDFRELRLKR